MAVNLSNGSIELICNGASDLKPFLQVFDIKLVNTAQNTTERYRMVLSDGVYLQQAMLATQMNHIFKTGKLQKGSIVQLKEFICNIIQGRKIIIVINLQVIVDKSDPIGEPKPYMEVATVSNPAAPQGRPPLPGLSSSMDPPGTGAINQQSYGGPFTGSASLGQNMAGGQAKAEPAGIVQPYGAGSGRNVSGGVPQYPKAEYGAASPALGGYANQSQNFTDNNSNSSSMGGPRSGTNTYGRPVQSSCYQPPPMYTNRGPIAKNEAPARIVPIAALNPYQGRWTIKARVTAKSALRRYNSPKGEGKVFSFDLLDSDGGEIRVTSFNAVADQFYDQIESGKVYLVSKGSLKPAQKTFNNLNSEWEIFLESSSTIQPCLEEDNSIPKQQFNFRSIGDIESIESNSMIDVIGIVSSINPSSTILRKNGTETHKRTLQLKDMSGRSVELTLWGDFCNAEGQELQNMCDAGVFPVLAVKFARVNDFNGKTVGTISNSQIFINPEFPEAHKLHEWYNNEGKNVSSVSISRDSSSMGRTEIRKTVSQIKDEGLGRSEKPDWITVKATISFIKTDSFCYTACPLMMGDRQCNKKVNNNGDGMWQCERCDQSFAQCDYRYLLQLQIQDYTGVTWVTAFQESAEEIMGITAKDLYLLKYEEQDDAKFGEIVSKILFTQFLFKLKVKEEPFGDEQRLRINVIKAERINFSKESGYLLSLVNKLSVDEPEAAPEPATNGVANTGMPYNGYIGVRQNPHSSGSRLGGGSISDRYGASQSNQMGQFGNSFGVAGPAVVSNTAYTLCNNCGTAGHYSQNCPSLLNGQAQQPMGGGNHGYPAPYNRMGAEGGSASGKCFKCNQSGHWARDCPSSTSSNFTSSRSGLYQKGGF